MRTLQKFSLAAAAAALFALSSASQAVVISAGSSNPYPFSWTYSSAAGPLTGSGTLSLTGFNTSALTVNITLNNTSALSGNRLTAFGFGINPNATSITFSDLADGGIVNASLSSIPGLANIEVCAFGGPNCSGGGNGNGGSGGISGGASDSFAVILGGTWGSSVTIDPIGFKYQTGSGSFEFTTSSSGNPSSGNAPEPHSTALVGLGLGLLGYGFARRRKQQDAA